MQPSRLRTLLWLGTAILGVTAALAGLWMTEPQLIIGGLCLPFLGAFWWGRQLRWGLIAGYGALIVGPPAATIWLAYGLYWVTEWLARCAGLAPKPDAPPPDRCADER